MTVKGGRTVPVLMYHHVSPEPGMITCTPEHFEDQLRWLQRHGYRSLTSARFAEHLAGHEAPPRSVLITFDDGYLDNWVYAYPLLKKYGFNALVFLVTAWVGEGAPRARMGETGLPATPAHAECERLIQAGSRDHILRWSEIRHMRDDGCIEFHSHTHTHTRWDKSAQASMKNERMRDELEHSRETLRTHLGEVSDHLCWPQGYFDDDYVRIAQESGFRYLYTTYPFGRNRPGSDPTHIYRFAVRNTHGASVGRRIRVAANPVVAPVFNGFKRWKRSLRTR